MYLVVIFTILNYMLFICEITSVISIKEITGKNLIKNDMTNIGELVCYYTKLIRTRRLTSRLKPYLHNELIFFIQAQIVEAYECIIKHL